MKLLKKDTDYAIRALIFLSRSSGDFFSTREISEKQHIPYQFLRRIVNQLIKKNILEVREGINGGVRLKKNPSEITVLSIINILQGDVEISECMIKKKICDNRANCILRCEIKRIELLINNEFSKLTIENLGES